MIERVRECLLRLQQRAKMGAAVSRFAVFSIHSAMALVVAVAVLYAQGQTKDKYSLKSPDGIAFADFRGYEDWATASSARTADVQKVIVANRAMIETFKAGASGNGQHFPEGSKIVKLHRSQKKSTEATLDVDVPDVFKQAFAMEKDSKGFPKTEGWGYAVLNYDAATGA